MNPQQSEQEAPSIDPRIDDLAETHRTLTDLYNRKAAIEATIADDPAVQRCQAALDAGIKALTEALENAREGHPAMSDLRDTELNIEEAAKHEDFLRASLAAEWPSPDKTIPYQGLKITRRTTRSLKVNNAAEAAFDLLERGLFTAYVTDLKVKASIRDIIDAGAAIPGIEAHDKHSIAITAPKDA